MDTPEQIATTLLTQIQSRHRAARHWYVVWGKCRRFLAYPDGDSCAIARYGDQGSRHVGRYTKDVSIRDLAEDIEHYQLTVQQVRRVEVVE